VTASRSEAVTQSKDPFHSDATPCRNRRFLKRIRTDREKRFEATGICAPRRRCYTFNKPYQPTETQTTLPIYQAVVLAIIQGFAEFIPVSSSAHLIIVRRLLGWNELSPAHELSFDVALHFGTLLSVLFYFRRTWFQIVRAALGGKVVRFSEAGGSDVNLTADEQKEERMLLWFLAAATIPGAIAGKLLEHSAEDYFREHIVLIAAALIVVALLMWLGEKVSRMEKPLTRISLTDALLVGVAQAAA